jgi:hypothetical protein
MTLIEGNALSKGTRVRASVDGRLGTVVEVYRSFADVHFDGESEARAMAFVVIDRLNDPRYMTGPEAAIIERDGEEAIVEVGVRCRVCGWYRTKNLGKDIGKETEKRVAAEDSAAKEAYAIHPCSPRRPRP